jgi:hypothetical protein
MRMDIENSVSQSTLNSVNRGLTSGNESYHHLAMKLDVARDLLVDGWVVGVEERVLGKYYADVVAVKDNTVKVVEVGNVPQSKLEDLREEFDEVQNIPYFTDEGDEVYGQKSCNSGKQVYISDEMHTKLKIASTIKGKDMGDIVDEHIEDMDVPGWKSIDPEQVKR